MRSPVRGDADNAGAVRKVMFGLMLAAMAAAGVPAGAQTATPTAPTSAPPPTPLETPADALAQDAVEYAKQFSVPVAEAIRRLTAQQLSVPITDELAEKYRDRLAGIAIEHTPVYRIIVYLAGEEPVREKMFKAGGFDVPIAFRTGARVTRDRVIWAMTWHQRDIRAALPRPPGIGLDPRTGELVVIVGPSDVRGSAADLKAKLETIAEVPVQLRILKQTDKNLDIAGGARMEGTSPADGKRYICTSAFAVGDGTRTALTTAAHCLDNMNFRDPKRGVRPLEFLGQWGWGYRDVQLHGSAEPLPPAIYTDTEKTRLRPITGQRTRAATRAGDFVCHRGERTGYSCALVELTDFAPAGDICGGACLPTWVTVAGPSCKGGDSGSPVFSGTTAFGILKGGSYRGDGSCAFYFYMSVDYLPVGWSLLHAAPDGSYVPAYAPAPTYAGSPPPPTAKP
ncbi:hypothetical protein [Sphingomonas sp. Leaf357]|uniref:hypothetical protein n=1 Tax=Sphingomonas sp. Leaf357 TaxID=1736350 RepID=UPI00191BD5D7|nr:hypothetical protein [Sphingomonas sp. Leaf357]